MAKYIGLDLGSKTIGVAISEGYFANVHSTIRFEEDNFSQAVDLLKKLLEKEGYEKIIVGYPKNMDGSIGHRVEMIEDFLTVLYQHSNVKEEEIIKIDERLTTRMAKSLMIEANLSRKKQKINKDQIAAKLILETYLQQIKL
ncbi:Holliday junction resolvase RuvX [Spiroplasma culicicola]|uniref:Putative pre-16S rRNA nuclease n=1 Tax=Spiroplasma culicicola AES-1 TaxID=1276246 RepID=W6A6E6_9MOLU|nr:Holliday junction resolvase RuvX [Spiroplasma culicicola]AHI52572.1 Holliday junction resolvase-like protein [Spiroplasma culicicola AES-1]